MKFLSNIIRYAKIYRYAVNVNFNYTIPDDLSTCIFDFYMLNYLHDGISEKDYRQLVQDKYNTFYRNEKQVEAQINVNNAYNKLCNFLKDQFKDLLYYQIAREFSHVPNFYKDNEKNTLDNLNQDEKLFLFTYLKTCKSNGVTGEGQSKFEDGKKIIDILNPDKIFFVNIAKKIFNYTINKNGYGGENWINICDAYLMFNTVPIGTAIDHVFDLQHNTGSIFYKHPDYKYISDNIKIILDIKRNASYPMVYIKECSQSIQDACKYLLHLKDNIAQDQFGDSYDSIIDNLIQDEQYDTMFKLIINDKITNNILIEKIVDTFIKGQLVGDICNLIDADKIENKNTIAKTIPLLVEYDKYSIICKLIEQNKIQDDNTLNIIVKKGRIWKYINNEITNTKSINKIFQLIIKNKDYSSLVLSLQNNKITDQNIINQIIELLIQDNKNNYLSDLIIRKNITDKTTINRIIKHMIEKNAIYCLMNLMVKNAIKDKILVNQIIQNCLNCETFEELYWMIEGNEIKYKNIVNKIIEAFIENKQFYYLDNLIKHKKITDEKLIEKIENEKQFSQIDNSSKNQTAQKISKIVNKLIKY